MVTALPTGSHVNGWWIKGGHLIQLWCLGGGAAEGHWGVSLAGELSPAAQCPHAPSDPLCRCTATNPTEEKQRREVTDNCGEGQPESSQLQAEVEAVARGWKTPRPPDP